jgi:hypothetical protein
MMMTISITDTVFEYYSWRNVVLLSSVTGGCLRRRVPIHWDYNHRLLAANNGAWQLTCVKTSCLLSQILSTSARNGNFDVQVEPTSSRRKQIYTIRKVEKKDKWMQYILVSTSINFRNTKEVPVWYTGICWPFRALDSTLKQATKFHILHVRYSLIILSFLTEDTKHFYSRWYVIDRIGPEQMNSMKKFFLRNWR